MKRSAGSRAPPAAAHIKALPSAGALRAGQPQLRRGERDFGAGKGPGGRMGRAMTATNGWRTPGGSPQLF